MNVFFDSAFLDTRDECVKYGFVAAAATKEDESLKEAFGDELPGGKQKKKKSMKLRLKLQNKNKGVKRKSDGRKLEYKRRKISSRMKNILERNCHNRRIES